MNTSTSELNISPEAKSAIYAAQNLRNWGVYATARYCARRNVSAELLLTAISCEQSSVAKAVWM